METTYRVKLYLAITGLTLVLAAGGYATMAPKAEKYAPPPLGSTFTYSQTETGSFGSGNSNLTMKVTERTWEGKRMIALVFPKFVILFEKAVGAWAAFLTPDDKPIFTWNPPIGYDFPLEVGKTWTKSYQVTNHSINRTMPFDGTWKVESYEDVNIPAGTFKVFKVSYSDTIGNENVEWFDPALGVFVKASRKRTANAPTGPGTQERELISQTITK